MVKVGSVLRILILLFHIPDGWPVACVDRLVERRTYFCLPRRACGPLSFYVLLLTLCAVGPVDPANFCAELLEPLACARWSVL